MRRAHLAEMRMQIELAVMDACSSVVGVQNIRAHLRFDGVVELFEQCAALECAAHALSRPVEGRFGGR